MFRQKITTCALIIAFFILILFLYFAHNLHNEAIDGVNIATMEDLEETTNEEILVDVDVEVVEISEIDLRKGCYIISTYVDVQYDPAEFKQQPDFMIKDATVLDKKLLKHEIGYDGRITDIYFLVTSHSFTPNIYYYPLDWQVLTFDMLSKNPYDDYSLKLRSFNVQKNIDLDSYTLQTVGSTVRTATIEIGAEELFKTYMSRGYIVLKHSSFLFYLRSFQLMLVSVILALISFLSVSDNARFGAIIGALLVSMGNITGLLSKVCDGQSMTLLDVSSLYYILVIVGVLIMVSVNSRKRYNLDQIDKKIASYNNMALNEGEIADLKNGKKELEALIKNLDFCAVIALSVMISGYFFGVYILTVWK